MILNFVFDEICSAAAAILVELFNDLHYESLLSFLAVGTSYLFNILAYVYYFLPVTYLLPLLGVVGSIIAFRIMMAVFRLVCELLSALGIFT